MHPKRTISKKKHNRKTVQRKSKKQKHTMSQSQNVYVYTHKPQTQRTQSHVRKNTHNTVSTPIIVPFVQPLPPNHPFNVNVPQNQSGVSPNIPVNTYVPQISALAAQTGAVPTPHTPYATPHTPVPAQPVQKRAKRGKKITGNHLPSIEGAVNSNLDEFTTQDLNNIIDSEIKDSGNLFAKKSDRKNKQKVKSAIKRARDQQMREFL